MSVGHVALIVVDVQKDFCEGGALAVPGGNYVAHRIADYIEESRHNYAKIVFTKDWHNPPPDTNGGHFDEWPVHCVQGTNGADLHDAFTWIYHHSETPIFYKGMGRPDYSGFQGTHKGQTLNGWLLMHDIDEVHVVGIAGDFCVRATALDAKAYGFRTYVLPSLVASVGGSKATEAVTLEVALA